MWLKKVEVICEGGNNVTNWIRKLGKRLAVKSESLTNWFKKLVKLSPEFVAWCIRLQAQIWRRWSKNRLLAGFCSVLEGLVLKFNKTPTEFPVTAEILLSLPNLLCLARAAIMLLLLPISLLAEVPKLIVLVVYLFSMSLDLLDGPIARQANLTSEIGKIIDPVCDKICHLSIALIATFAFKVIPSWLFFSLLGKEVIMAVMAPFFKNGNSGARWFGKAGAILETAVLAFSLLFVLPDWVFLSLAATQVVILTIYLIIFLRRPTVAAEETKEQT